MAISILLDLSESANAVGRGTGMTMSALMRDAVLLLGATLSTAGEWFAISGFSSNGRHQVKLTNFKTFCETFEESKKLLLVITDGAPSDIDVYDKNYLQHDSRHAVHALQNRVLNLFALTWTVVLVRQ